MGLPAAWRLPPESFEKAGEEYGKSFSLTEDTIAGLQSLMISKEDYIQGVNS